MTMNYQYKNASVLSKTKIGDVVYYLKDAEARAALAAEIERLGTAAYRNWSDTVANDENLVSGKAVVAYLEDTLSEVAKALVFQGVSTTDPLGEEGVVINGEVLVPAIGDVILYGVKEYVYDGNAWIELGDEGLYLTKADAVQYYVNKKTTIAGINLEDDITAEELIAALSLKALAFKDSASGQVTTIDEITIPDHTPAGSVDVKLAYASTTMASTGTLTPAGSVAGSTTAVGNVTIARDENGVQVSGTVSAPTITVTPSTTEVQHLTSVGSLPSYTAAQYTAPSVNESKSAFANEGLVATIDTEDAEMLVFTAASKSDAIVASGFNAGAYVPAEFNAGALPVLGDAQTVVTGIAAASASIPVFTGDKFGATFAGVEAPIAATFTGKEGAVNVSGSYDKANVESASFTGAAASVEVQISKSAKTITVQ